jgi:glyoxylate reductase
MKEIAVTSPLPGAALERLEGRYRVRLRDAPTALEGRELSAFVGVADALVCTVTDPVGEGVFAACAALQVVANVGVGVDNIDLEAARRAGVWVTNTPDVLTEATADLAWALLLAVTRRVAEGDRLIRAQRPWRWRPDFFLGRGLQGKTLGIVGMGRIGRAVARRALAFGMSVACHDPSPPVSGEASGARWVATVDELLPLAQVLSLHCSLTPQTRHLLDARRLALLPPGAVVINTSRGPVVDEEALLAALETGHLGGAGLDVFEHEPAVHPRLLERDDVVLLPHIGSATLETRTAMAQLAVDNAVAVLEGREPPTPVLRGRP